MDNGAPLAAVDLAGKPLLVNFWASWCVPCQRELPSLDRLAARRRDIVVVAVSVDEPTVGSHFGGQVSGPVFSGIVGDTLRALNVPPDMPVKQMVVTDDSNAAAQPAAQQPANRNNVNTAKKVAVSSNTKTHPGVVR